MFKQKYKKHNKTNENNQDYSKEMKRKFQHKIMKMDKEKTKY